MKFQTPIVLPDDALVYDIETDSLYQRGGPTVVHCLVVQHYRTREVFSFADHPGYASLADGVEILAEAPATVGHNAVSFDMPKLIKLCGAKLDRSRCLDTAILSRALLPDIASVFDDKLP